MVCVEKIVTNKIIAVVPLYIDMKGNSTKITTKESGDVFIYKTIHTVLKLLGKYFMIDLSASRKYYGEVIGASNIIPIPFDSENIFIPVKVRKPLSKNDGSFGYVNLKYIKDIEERKDGVYIVMKGNNEIKSLQRFKTVQKHINDGKIVKRIYDKRSNILVMDNSSSFYSQYHQPATKGDIALLRDELLAIKNKLQ
ncbi:hypothetical protein [Caldisalinibacter kiritimatiensis]|uniref:ComK protein n=1 Tax=Caldisalinibacter kiritimatiensis TaxID=1304284 RepID=R1CL13_9FIRM|nr:hypothetical protein [Caldisalinibacter kiritimatiensis]EOC99400.1 hypothetical protein L21TH_2581 [Caldisalinibacter kiritimatiensis]